MSREAGRIISLLPGGTEILLALGLGDHIVGVSHDCRWPNHLARVPRVTSTMIAASATSSQIDDEVTGRVAERLPLYQLDHQLIENLAPDLIVTQDHCEVCAVSLTEVNKLVATCSLSCPVVTLQPTRLQHLFDDVAAVSEAAGRLQAGAELLVSLRERLARVHKAVSGQPVKDVLCVEWIEPLMSAGNWVPDVVAAAGGAPLLATAGEYSSYRSWSEIDKLTPDAVVVAPCGFDRQRTIRELRDCLTRPHWQRLLERPVFVLDGNRHLNMVGPSLIDSTEILARILHPACSEWKQEVFSSEPELLEPVQL